MNLYNIHWSNQDHLRSEIPKLKEIQTAFMVPWECGNLYVEEIKRPRSCPNQGTEQSDWKSSLAPLVTVTSHLI